MAAAAASRGSFEEAAAAIERATGHHMGKRQVENLTARAATDVEEFYATTTPSTSATATRSASLGVLQAR
ncbi:MAG: hypothetical protein ACRDY2_12305 [Acidimicrobiales bacterium]